MSDDWEIIYSYTREEALRDGVLVDVTNAARGRFKVPVAITEALNACLEETGDRNGAISDVLWMAFVAARSAPNSSVVFFDVRLGRKIYHLKSVVGPGDEGEPVITIMYRDED